MHHGHRQSQRRGGRWLGRFRRSRTREMHNSLMVTLLGALGNAAVPGSWHQNAQWADLARYS